MMPTTIPAIISEVSCEPANGRAVGLLDEVGAGRVLVPIDAGFPVCVGFALLCVGLGEDMGGARLVDPPGGTGVLLGGGS